MSSRAIAVAFLIATLWALTGNSTVQAQVTVDAAKITCRQYLTGKIATPRSVANWLSGYFHGERGDTTARSRCHDDGCGKIGGFLSQES